MPSAWHHLIFLGGTSRFLLLPTVSPQAIVHIINHSATVFPLPLLVLFSLVVLWIGQARKGRRSASHALGLRIDFSSAHPIFCGLRASSSTFWPFLPVIECFFSETMPAILNFSDDEIHRGLLHSDIMESSLFLSLAPSFDIQYPLLKRQRVAAPFILREEHMKTAALLKKQKPCSIDALPDECLFEIFRRLPRSRERCIAACVSKRWLMLLSSIKASEFVGHHKGSKPLPDLNCTEPWELDQDISFESCGQLMRCLEAEEANDVRLAAIAVCAPEGGGLNKLNIRGDNSACKVTDLGLSAIGRCCSSLSALSMWRLPLVSDAGLMAIADGCPKLENVDFSHCCSISDKGLIAIAKKCPNLVSVTIDSCPGISNDGLQAVGRYCSKLLSISIKDCPLVGDKGISSLVASASSSLMKIKLQNVNVSDLSLAVIGHYGKAVTDISLTALQNVTERGFWVMGNALNMASLTSCTISCCPGLTDLGLEAIAKGCQLLKHLCVRRSSNLSDTGLKSVSLSARMLEGLQLEECNRITLKGVLDGLLSYNARFRSLVMIKCLGIRDIAYYPQELPTCWSLRSLTIRGCPGFTSSSLAVVGKICPNLSQIDLSGLVGVTDSGILPLIETSEPRLVKVNLEGCVSLSDASISSLVKYHGSTLKFLNLDGCVKVTDRSLLAISANCSVLKDLDVSRCSVSDFGVAAIASSEKLNLRTLSLAGCYAVTKRSLSFLGKMKESLEGLNLQQCKLINAHGIGSLEEKLWWCDIIS